MFTSGYGVAHDTDQIQAHKCLQIVTVSRSGQCPDVPTYDNQQPTYDNRQPTTDSRQDKRQRTRDKGQETDFKFKSPPRRRLANKIER